MVSGRRTAKDIMTTPVHTVRPGDPLEKVVGLMCRHRVSGVPVVEGEGRLVGLISERHIIHAMVPGNGDGPKGGDGEPAGGQLKDVREFLARDVMVTKVITANPETEFLRLASIMALQKIRRIPIVKGDMLVGIVSHGDVSRAIFGNTERPAVCPAMRNNDDPPSGSGS